MIKEKAHSANKNILGSLIKSAAMIYGFYQLLNSGIFRGNDFLRKDLTKAEVDLMDKHNDTHRMFEDIHSHGKGLLATFGVDEREVVDRTKEINSFDAQIESLPSPLNHKHR